MGMEWWVISTKGKILCEKLMSETCYHGSALRLLAKKAAIAIWLTGGRHGPSTKVKVWMTFGRFESAKLIPHFERKEQPNTCHAILKIIKNKLHPCRYDGGYWQVAVHKIIWPVGAADDLYTHMALFCNKIGNMRASKCKDYLSRMRLSYPTRSQGLRSIISWQSSKTMNGACNM